MNKLFVSAGLVALGAAAMESAIADDAAGPKYWSVGATLRGFYDDNYAVSAANKGSAGIELSPTVSGHLPLQQTDMGIRYTYGLYYYQGRNDVGQNPFDQTHDVDLWLDHAFNESWSSKVTDTIAVGQEPELLNPNPTTAVATPYRVNGDNISNHGNVLLATDWSRELSSELTYQNGYFDYDNSGGAINPVTGQINAPGYGTNSAPATLGGLLDRIEQTVGADLKWHLSPETTLLAGYEFSWVGYNGNEPIAVVSATATKNAGFVYHSSDRDSYTHYVYLGVEHDFTPNFNASVRAGGSYTDVYGDPIDPSQDWSPYANVALSYTYLPGSFLQFGFTEDVSSTDQVGADNNGNITQYANNAVVYLDVNHKITQKLMASLVGRIQYTTYQGGAANTSDTTTYSTGLNLSYQFNPHFSMDAGYNYDDVTSQISGYGYTRNRVYLGVSANY